MALMAWMNKKTEASAASSFLAKTIIGVLIIFLAIFIFVPLRNSANYPFLPNETFDLCLLLLVYIFVWLKLAIYKLRHARHKTKGEILSTFSSFIVFVIAVPFLFAKLLLSLSIWIPFYFGRNDFRFEGVLSSTSKEWKHRKYMTNANIVSPTGKTIHLEWYAPSNPGIPEIGTKMIGKMICLSGRSSFSGIIVESIALCPS